MTDGEGCDVAVAVARILALLAPSDAAFSGSFFDETSLLQPVPEEAFLRNMALRRRLDFRCGRYHARNALAALGEPPCLLPRTPAGAVRWPSGTTGSISHCERYCGAVAVKTSATASIGFDVEIAEGISPNEATIVATADELDRMEVSLDMLFSIKESAYKAIAPFTTSIGDFREIAVRFDRSCGRFLAQPALRKAGSEDFLVHGYAQRIADLIVSVCVPRRIAP